MSYQKIPNLYRPEAQDILLFKECYALEKVHGTSAHLRWKPDPPDPAGMSVLSFFSGGEPYERFVALFDQADLRERFAQLGHNEVTVYGEAYGGKQQGMSKTYGKELCFIVFEVKVGEAWLSVKGAEDVAGKLGLEFVPYARILAELPCIDAERDRPSEVAKRRGISEEKPREGVVLRPIYEFRAANGSRVIAKHKREEFRETATPREVDTGKLVVLKEAEAVAAEWVTGMRLEHVLGKEAGWEWPRDVGKAIRALTDDVKAESEGEVEWGKDVEKAVGKAASQLLKRKGLI